MRPIIPLLLPLLALLPQPLAAQVLPYDLDFEQAGPVPDGEPGGERLVALRGPAEPGAGFAVQAWEEETGEGEARPFHAVVHFVPFAGEMGRWMRFDDPARLPAPAEPARRAGYGPFRILDESRAALAGVTDAGTPAAFDAMLRDHPGIATLELVDCPGTEDDRANLRLGLMIRAKGIATHVPEGGWVASGAVELFLAGTQRSAEAGARFAVHSWEDDAGRGPGDYAPDAPKNRAYIDYYRTMGMSEGEARAFYAMTNATPFSRPRQLTAAEMARWARLDPPAAWPVPRGTFAQALPVAGGVQVLPAAF